MPLIDRHGAVIPDRWVEADAIVSLERLLETGEGDAVVLAPDTVIEKILVALPRLKLIAIEFPKFRDGRGFTLAHSLRFKHGFKGEIRAVGHVIPDQITALIECGFSSVMTPPEHPPEQWLSIAAERSTPHPPQLLNRLVARTR